MAIEFNREAYDKVFNDLEKFKNFCRFNLDRYGNFFPFNEADLYNKNSYVWRAYLNRNKPFKKGNFKNKRKFN